MALSPMAEDQTLEPGSSMPSIPIKAQDTLEQLPWDSKHFGFQVALIKGAALGDFELQQALLRARQTNTRLVYWSTDPRREVPQSILEEFHGCLVNRKVTFRKTLNPTIPDGESAMSWRIAECPRSEPGFDLVRLAVAAGAYSRFRLDPRISRASFQRLYEAWIVRSLLGELAEVVLVADRGISADDPVGLVTVSLTGGQGSMGLIAVDGSSRGQGVGTQMIHEAHRWLRGRGARNVKVVTQLDNRRACRLYERNGYTHADLTHVYHFWP